MISFSIASNEEKSRLIDIELSTDSRRRVELTLKI